MPEICRFYGIIIRIFTETGAQHHTPHIHAYYQLNFLRSNFSNYSYVNILELFFSPKNSMALPIIASSIDSTISSESL